MSVAQKSIVLLSNLIQNVISPKPNLARLNRKVDQVFSDTDQDQSSKRYSMNNLEEEIETLVLDTPTILLHENDETDDVDADHFFTLVGAVSVESARHLVTDLQNYAFTHTIFKEPILSEKDPSIYLT